MSVYGYSNIVNCVRIVLFLGEKERNCYKRSMVTIQQVCAHAALTVRTHRLESKNPISEADLEWIFARNYEGTEQLRKFFQISAAIAIITQKFKLINSGLHEIMIIAKPCRNESVRSPWELAHKGLLIMNTHGENAKK